MMATIIDASEAVNTTVQNSRLAFLQSDASRRTSLHTLITAYTPGVVNDGSTGIARLRFIALGFDSSI